MSLLAVAAMFMTPGTAPSIAMAQKRLVFPTRRPAMWPARSMTPTVASRDRESTKP